MNEIKSNNVCKLEIKGVEGIVTEVNSYYGYFKIDNVYTIYMSLLKRYSDKCELPVLKSRVKVNRIHKFGNILIACKLTTFEGNFNTEFKSNQFTELIHKNKFGIDDLIRILKVMNLINVRFDFLNTDLSEKVVTLLIKKLVDTRGIEIREKHCLNSVIANVDVVSISSCKHVKIFSNEYENFPEWTLGVHSNLKDTVLFGFIYIHEFGLFMIKDLNYNMVLFITNKESNCLELENTYVLINKYRVINEVYSDSKTKNFEYLIVDASDIHVIYNTNKNVMLSQLPPSGKFRYTTDFILCMKSTVCLRRDDKTESYLEIILEEKKNERVFLILSSSFNKILFSLKEGFKYKLYHNNLFKNTICNLLTAVKQLKCCSLEDKNFYFQEIGIEDASLQPMKISDCSQFPKNNIFSFEGNLQERGFAINKYTTEFSKSKMNFCTPGNKIHTISFSSNKTDGLVVFLSNWLNRLVPLGLIPDMRVIVRNVINKSSYIKPTVFTHFEIVSYDQKLSFETVNLFEYSDIDWGRDFFFSKGNSLPTNIIVWSVVHKVFIKLITLKTVCEKCFVVIKGIRPCIKCQGERKVSNFSLIMSAMDSYGESEIIVRDMNFLRIALDIEEIKFSHWKERFINIGEYYYNVKNPHSYKECVTFLNNFCFLLSTMIDNFNSSIISFEIKCRKQIDSVTRNLPQWEYLDARRIIN